MRDPFFLTPMELRRLAPFGDDTIQAGLAAHSALLEDYGIAANELRLCHFLAQAAHETAGFKTLVEYGGEAYFRRRYGHRRDLGNRQPSDGPRYRGRGIFQLTGRSNYRLYGQLLQLDLEGEPQLAARPEVSLRVAAEYWRRNGLNRLADSNDIRAITKKINGGTYGLADRRRYFARALSIWPDARGKPLTRALRVGDSGSKVRRLQQLLSAKGYPLVIDGLFGRETRRALRTFQKAAGLRADGVYGPLSRARLQQS